MSRFLGTLAAIVTMLLAVAPSVAQMKDAEKALKRGNHDEALGYVDTVLNEKPEDAKALELKGSILAAKSSIVLDLDEHAALLERALDSYAAAAATEPKLFDKLQNRITLAYLDEIRNGFESYAAAQQSGRAADYVTAAAYFRGATALAPDSAEAYLNWGFSLMNANRSVEAITPLQAAVTKGVRDVDAIKYLSNLYMMNDRADEAVTLLEEITAEFPDNQTFTTQLLNAYAISGQTERAAEYYVQAIIGNPNKKVYLYNFGSLLLQEERYDEAIEQLKAAVDLDPEYADAQYNLGAAYVNKAIAVNDEITQMDDRLRSNRAKLSKEEISEIETATSELTAERGNLFALAIEPLEKARTLYEEADKNVESICQLLFQSYVQAGRMENAADVQACAGYE
jgi:tetratricopeptide (TPR) repeat protein